MRMYQALGQLDALNAGAQLYARNPGHFSVPVFVELQYPWLTIQNYWNPFLDPKKAVTNSLELDGVVSEQPRTAIITGPNGKGKTTTTTLGITLAVLMAQSLALAPASELVMAPCVRIAPLIKVETNIARDRSLLMSLAERVGVILRLLKEPGFKCIALDEPCSGATKDQLAHAAAQALIEEVGMNPNTLCVTTTHFQEPTALEAQYPHIFKNYKIVPGFRIAAGVGAFENEDAGLSIFGQFAGHEFMQKISTIMNRKHHGGQT